MGRWLLPAGLAVIFAIILLRTAPVVDPPRPAIRTAVVRHSYAGPSVAGDAPLAATPATRSQSEIPFAWDPSHSMREQILEELRITRFHGPRAGFNAALQNNRSEAGRVMLELFRDSTLPPLVRAKALGYLAQLEAPGSLDVLKEVLSTSEFRGQALDIVKHRGDASFVAPVMELAATPLRRRVIEVLGYLGSPQAIPLLDRLSSISTGQTRRELEDNGVPADQLDEMTAEVWREERELCRRAKEQILIASGANPMAEVVPHLYGSDLAMSRWGVNLLLKLNPPDLEVQLRNVLNQRRSTFSKSRRYALFEDEYTILNALHSRGRILTPAEAAWLSALENGRGLAEVPIPD